MKSILLRFDDICPTMNWALWEEAKQQMDKVGVKALLGVVPDCQDPMLQIDEPRTDFWEYVKSLQEEGHTIAMHGYQHVFEIKADGIITNNKISEFAGLPYKVQLEKIQKGKLIFKEHGIETDVFFAPAHSYDDNTLRALSACGFRYVSDGYSKRPYLRNGIIMLPCRSIGLFRKKLNHRTLVVHAHEWTRVDKKADRDSYYLTLRGDASDIVPFSVFSQWHCGNSLIQDLSEKIILFIIFRIRPVLSRIKNKIRK